MILSSFMESSKGSKEGLRSSSRIDCAGTASLGAEGRVSRPLPGQTCRQVVAAPSCTREHGLEEKTNLFSPGVLGERSLEGVTFEGGDPGGCLLEDPGNGPW